MNLQLDNSFIFNNYSSIDLSIAQETTESMLIKETNTVATQILTQNELNNFPDFSEIIENNENYISFLNFLENFDEENNSNFLEDLLSIPEIIKNNKDLDNKSNYELTNLSEKRLPNNEFKNLISHFSMQTSHRWSAEEVIKLKELVETFKNIPNKWKEIATYIPEKTPAQCYQKWFKIHRSKAGTKAKSKELGKSFIYEKNSGKQQNTQTKKRKNDNEDDIDRFLNLNTENDFVDSQQPFNALEKESFNTSIQAPNKKWSEEEDIKLRNLVEKSKNKYQWKKIAAQINNGKTSKQCQSRWTYIKNLTHEIVRRWPNKEVIKLKELVEKFEKEPKKWEKIAVHMQGKTANQCHQKWLAMCRLTIQEGSEEKTDKNKGESVAYQDQNTQMNKRTKYDKNHMSFLLNSEDLDTKDGYQLNTTDTFFNTFLPLSRTRC